MPFLRSLTVFILSLIFISSIFIAITSYTIGPYIQKNSIKNFITSESTTFINQQCQENCNQYADYKDTCVQLCLSQLANQTQSSVDKTVNEVYQQKFFGITLDEMTFVLFQVLLFFILGLISGILLLVASKTRFLTLGKNFISLAISLFISSLTPQFIVASVNLPFSLGQAIKDYLSPGFNQQMYYGIIFLIAGIVLIIIGYALRRKKNEINKKK